MDYQKYLKSDEWRAITRRIWRKADGKCASCGGKGNHVHHKTYDRLGHEDDEDLELLCRFCHDRRHGRLWDAIERDYKALFGEELDTSEFPGGFKKVARP